MTKKHTIAVTFKSKPECLMTFKTIMQSVKKELPLVDGCDSVRVMTNLEDPSMFLLLEDWESSDLHKAHISQMVASGEWAKIEEMLSEKPESITLEQV